MLHQAPDSPRRSEDVDLFHDTVEALELAYQSDLATLRDAGFSAEPVGRSQPEFHRAVVRRADLQTKLEWVQDSAVRFFPVEQDIELGWRLNFWDAATNKVLALVGRQKIRDYLDCLYLHGRHLHIGALAWAAAGKDPGLTPELIIDWASRGNRFRPEDLAEVRLSRPVDLRANKQIWLEALAEARALIEKLPIDELGCLYLNNKGEPVCPKLDSPDFTKLTRHFGSVKGAWPRIIEG